MKVIDVYTKKAYKCSQCNAEIYYGKITDDDGNIYTVDGKMPNGVFGKGNNVLSGAVDALVKDKLHECKKHYVEDAVAKCPPSPFANGVKMQETPTPQTPKEPFTPEFVNEQEAILWNDLVGKVTEYVILAQQKLDEYPEITNPALKGLITNKAFETLAAIKEAQRNG